MQAHHPTSRAAALIMTVLLLPTMLVAQPARLRVTDASSSPVPYAVVHVGSGKRVHREGPQRRASIVGTRGSCTMTILIDGVRVNNLLAPGDEAARERMSGIRGSSGRSNAEVRSSIDEMLDGSSVSAVEVYPSSANAPAELIPLTGGGSCGLIAIWTGGRS